MAVPNQNFLAAGAGWSGGKPVYAILCPETATTARHIGTYAGRASSRDVYEIAEALCEINAGDVVTALFGGKAADGRDVYLAYRCPCDEGSGSGSDGSGSGSEGSGSEGSGSGSEGSGSEGYGSDGYGSEGSGS
ncbi:MAG: hypothetical protein L0228_09995, partial [Planctomycetes bacterium]|nr:hypothetical protein [Planctomycetota bacterium]